MRREPAGFRRRRLALTPLIDVIFLLLLFFMLSSTFSRFGEVDLSVAASGATAASGTPPVFLRLDDAGLTLNGRPIAPGEIGAAVERFRGAGEEVRLLLGVADGATAQGLVDAVALLRRVPDSVLAVVR